MAADQIEQGCLAGPVGTGQGHPVVGTQAQACSTGRSTLMGISTGRAYQDLDHGPRLPPAGWTGAGPLQVSVRANPSTPPSSSWSG